MSGGQGMPFPPQLLAGFPGMQGGGMGFLGHLANPNNLQSLLPPELMQQFQQVDTEHASTFNVEEYALRLMPKRS